MPSRSQALRRHESTYTRVLRGLETLSREGLVAIHAGGKVVPLRLMTEHSQVLLLSPEHDVRHAFQLQEPEPAKQRGGVQDGAGAAVCDIFSGRKCHPLTVSDRVRRAVLEPAEVPPALPDAIR